MKVAIYSPYLDTLGGGERYMMTIAETLASDHKVDILLDSHLYVLDTEKIIKTMEERFGLDLKGVNLVEAPLGIGSNSVKRSIFLMNYDLLFYLTDGSIFYPTSTRNILHIQSPIEGQAAKSFWGKTKLSGWDLIIYNSKFTKEHSQKYWNLKSEVLYPPVDIDSIKVLEKKNQILSVGRFSAVKKQEVLIKVFKNLHKSNKIPGWELILAGSAQKGDMEYVEQLKQMSKGFPIEILTNLDYKALIKLYGESSIYWHAAGFEEEDPARMEHFGISTVEAMAGGCIPVVINKGGQKEIVENKVSGFLWNSLKDLEELTLKLTEDEKLRIKLSRKAVTKAQNFSKKIFTEKIHDLVY